MDERGLDNVVLSVDMRPSFITYLLGDEEDIGVDQKPSGVPMRSP